METETVKKPKLRIKKSRLIMGVLLLAILVIVAFFLKDILIPFLKLQLKNDVDGAAELIRSRGVQGFFSITLVEALQMVIVFISAEFIQIAAGLSYPFYIAILLCDLGVCLGATIIFVLVRIFHTKNEAFEKRRAEIDRLSKSVHDRNTVILLYFLFIMPMIPFGAICYYASGTKLTYRRYLLTVATGAIPSIVTSNLMGAAGMAFIKNALPFWLLILIIVVLAALLFVGCFLLIRRFCFNGLSGTPESMMYTLLMFLARIFIGRRRKTELLNDLPADLEAPYLMLVNHESFYDFLYATQLSHPKNPSILLNDYYARRKLTARLAKEAGLVTKKLFNPDISSVARMLRTIRNGSPLLIFPEGRLSTDGRSNRIVEPGAAFYKKLGAPIVLTKIEGAYFNDPKWRKKHFRGPVTISVVRVIQKEEAAAMSDRELDELIEKTLFTDASKRPGLRYKQHGKAEGIEKLLYRCPDCGALYQTVGIRDDLVCTACGARHTLDETYHFSDGLGSLAEAYDRLAAMEKAGLPDLFLHAEVRTKIFGAEDGKVRREKGECLLTNESFRYRSESTDFTIPLQDLPALAYSSGTEFELYHKNELHYFYPVKDPQQTVRWALIVDLLAAERRKEA